MQQLRFLALLSIIPGITVPVLSSRGAFEAERLTY